MKVLFAVNNENISSQIVKRYQKDYKEIISYKNVYYFNAILKELQRDKSYDRIVISEDLEPFANNNYDIVDKFIFDKLDRISDEATNMGNDIPIILISIERRTKSEQMLVKLFGLGIYNVLLGQDRNIPEICKLLNKPRSKKDAKLYYKIESEEVNYQSENEDSVSEVEIQNILSHYKKLGKNEEKYVESFNNIASQYTDAQLKIIIKFLPLNVKAVLEANSPKYQSIMTFGGVKSVKNIQKEEKKEEGLKIGFIESKAQKTKIGKPIVVPTAINLQNVKKVKANKETISELKKDEIGNQKTESQEFERPNIRTQDIEEPKKENYETEQPDVTVVKRGRGRPKKVVEEPINPPAEPQVKRGRGRPKKLEQPNTELNKKTADAINIEAEKEKSLVEQGSNSLNKEDDLLKLWQEDILEENNMLDDDNFTGINLSDSRKNDNNERDAISSRIDNGYNSNNEDYYLPGLDDNNDESYVLPGVDDEDREFQDFNNTSNIVSKEENFSSILPGLDDDEIDNFGNREETNIGINNIRELSNTRNSEFYSNDIDSLLTKEKKIVSFVGTSKNGTSFLVNNLGQLISNMGIKTAILDMTENKNSYYIYTKNDEKLRNIAFDSMRNLKDGIANGIVVNKNLDVYTSLPDGKANIKDYNEILGTLVKKYSLVLIDCDFNTPAEIFNISQEIYIVQSLDILTIQPMTAFLRDLKAKEILKQEKIRIVLNKVVKMRGINNKAIIGGLAYYNDPAMSFMTELFNKDTVKFCEISFEEQTYTRYLEGIVNCEISLNGYTRAFKEQLRILANMVYPLINNKTRGYNNYSNGFTNDINNTLEQMKKKY